MRYDNMFVYRDDERERDLRLDFNSIIISEV